MTQITARLPALKGCKFDLVKTPGFSTLVYKSVSGRVITRSLAATPTYTFDLNFEYLRNTLRAGQVLTDLQQLGNFYVDQQGGALPFLLRDDEDNYASRALVPQNVASASYILPGGYGFTHPAPAGQVDPTTLAVYVNGALQAAGAYSFTYPNILVMNAALAAGTSLIANYTYDFLLRFNDDTMDLTRFMQKLWELQSCKLVSWRP